MIIVMSSLDSYAESFHRITIWKRCILIVSFTIAFAETDDEIQHAIEKLDIISEKYNVKFILSVSRDESKLPECAKAKIVISL